MCFPAERRKVDKDARACTVKDAYTLVLGSGNGLTVEMLRRTAPRIMPRRLIVVAEARLQAQIHKQAEQNKERRRISQTRTTSFVPTILNTAPFPTGPTSSEVSIFQLLGEDEDMVLLVVAASDELGDDEGIGKDSDEVEGERPKTTNAVPTSTDDTTPPHSTPTQTTSGRKRSNRTASQHLQHNQAIPESAQ